MPNRFVLRVLSVIACAGEPDAPVTALLNLAPFEGVSVPGGLAGKLPAPPIPDSMLRRAMCFRKALHPLDRPVVLPQDDDDADQLVARIMIISDSNTFTIYPQACNEAPEDAKDSDDEECTPQAIGCGLYLVGDMVNHSCEPNCEWEHDGSVLEMKSSKHIAEGEEITISYVPGDMPSLKRQRRLEQSYGFACSCTSCANSQ